MLLQSIIDLSIVTAIERHRQSVYLEPEDEDEVIELDWDLAKEIGSTIDADIEDYPHP
jgi:hypothetical protein